MTLVAEFDCVIPKLAQLKKHIMFLDINMKESQASFLICH